MTTPHFNSEEERKEFWAGWLEVRGTVWNVLKAEGIDKPTLEQYFAKGEQLSEEYIQEWESQHTDVETTVTPSTESVQNVAESVISVPESVQIATENVQNSPEKVCESDENSPEKVESAPNVTYPSTPMEPSNLEAPEIEDNEEEIEFTKNSRVIHGNSRKEEKTPSRSCMYFKLFVCLASIISALCVGGWIMPLVCITPLFLVFAYEQEKMQRAMVVHDSPDLYQYGTRSCQ